MEAAYSHEGGRSAVYNTLFLSDSMRDAAAILVSQFNCHCFLLLIIRDASGYSCQDCFAIIGERSCKKGVPSLWRNLGVCRLQQLNLPSSLKLPVFFEQKPWYDHQK